MQNNGLNDDKKVHNSKNLEKEEFDLEVKIEDNSNEFIDSKDQTDRESVSENPKALQIQSKQLKVFCSNNYIPIEIKDVPENVSQKPLQIFTSSLKLERESNEESPKYSQTKPFSVEYPKLQEKEETLGEYLKKVKEENLETDLKIEKPNAEILSENNGRIKKEPNQKDHDFFSCSYCNKKCSKLQDLKVHERTHAVVKPFACKYCEKKFSQSSTLLNHERTHTGEKPFACKYCEKKFTQSSYLKIHERIHTGEKPFACKYCIKKFSQSGSLNDHERVHTGEKPFACKYCEKKFAQSSDLRKHERIHTGEKPLTCKYCEKKFTE